MTWATDHLDKLVARTAEIPPVVETLRLGTLDAWGPGWARKRWSPQAALLQGDGAMFGGYLAALADQILAFAALTVVPEGQGFRTTGLSLQFFKLARNEPLDVEGKVIAQSKQMINVEAEIRNEAGDLIAKASAQQFVKPLPR